jgi:ABC-type branched-subunit amino acid transport system substrate-binding protein
MRADLTVKRLLAAATVVLPIALVAAGCGGTRDTIRIGYYGDCYGTFSADHQQSTIGAELPFIRRGAKPKGSTPSDGVGSITVAGKRVEFVNDCYYYGSVESELAAVRRLVEQQGVDILVTPGLIPDFAEKLYAPRKPHVAFISTGLIYQPPLPNVFRVSMSVRQASAGLGRYAYRTLGWRTAAIFGEDDPFGWSLASGFVAEFCSLGGTVVQRRWEAAEIANWSPLVRKLPRGVDGVALMTGLQGTKSFFSAYRKLQPNLHRHVVMSATAIEEAIRAREPVQAGIMAAGFLPFAPLGPAWTRYLDDSYAVFPRYRGQLAGPGDIYAYDAVELALEAIAQVHGDLSHGERRLMVALPRLLPHIQTPAGTLHFDRNLHAAGPNFLIEDKQAANAKRSPQTIREIPNVDESFGGYFTTHSPPDSSNQPICRSGHVPAWAR